VLSRLKEPARRGLRRAGFTLFSDRPPRDLANPLPVELAAHRLVRRALLDRLTVNCALDVGAHRGEYANDLRAAGYRGEIVSFEPGAAAFAVLEARAASDPGWRVHRLALGREAGRAQLGVARASNFSSFLAPTRFSLDWYGDSAVEHEEEVDVERLDAVFAAVTAHVSEPRVLLKTDTQGWDLEVLAGAEGCLDRVLALQVELSVRRLYEASTGWLDALAALADAGFRPAHLATVGRDAALGIVELDGLFIRDRKES
jgi:FkbM family methyltransferase